MNEVDHLVARVNVFSRAALRRRGITYDDAHRPGVENVEQV